MGRLTQKFSAPCYDEGPVLRIPIKTKSRNYEAIIESGVLSRAGELLRKNLNGNLAVFVVTVAPVRRRWGKLCGRP